MVLVLVVRRVKGTFALSKWDTPPQMLTSDWGESRFVFVPCLFFCGWILADQFQAPVCTVRVKIITGSLVILENLFPENYRYRYRLEIRMNYHYRYRLGPRSRPFISIYSQLPSRKSFELISSKLPFPLPS